MDYARQVQMTVRSLKGPALSVLVLMVWSRQWHAPVWDVKELIAGTGYDNEAISKARLTLIGLGLCEPAERGRIGLRLVDRAVQQLGLWDALPPVGDVVEGSVPKVRSENPISPSSSSLSSYIEGDARARGDGPQVRSENPMSPELQLLQPEVRSEKPISPGPEHPALPALARWLVDVIGCLSYRIASEAVKAALDEGMEPIDIKHEALWWWVYCANGSVTSIPRERWGFFIARKIQQGEFVYEGYSYTERVVREVNAAVFNEFLEVKYLYEAKTEGS